MGKSCIIILLLIVTEVIYSQGVIDSLEAELEGAEGKAKLEILLTLSSDLYDIDPDKGIEYGFNAFAIAETLKDSLAMGDALNSIGICYYAGSKNQTALKYFNRSVDIKLKIDDWKGISLSYNNLALLYDDLSDYSTATEYYLKSIDISKKHDFYKPLSKAYNNLGLLYFGMGEFDKADEFINKSIDVMKQNNDETHINASYANLGLIAENKGDYYKALDYFQKCLDSSSKTSVNFGRAICYSHFSSIYFALNDLNKAKLYANKAMEVNEAIGQIRGVLDNKNQLALIYFKEKKYTKAINLYKNNLKLCEEHDLVMGKVEIYNKLYQIYQEQGRLKLALTNYENYWTLKDSVLSNKTKEEVAQLQAKYESDSRQKENELLKSKNQLQALKIEQQAIVKYYYIVVGISLIITLVLLYYRLRSNKKAHAALEAKNEIIEEEREKVKVALEEVKKSNKTKDKFFSIIAHDLKSPFNAILGFTEMLNTQYEDYTDIERKKFIELLSSTSKNTFSLVENLLHWSRSQLGAITIEKKDIDLKYLVMNSIQSYTGSAKIKDIKVVNNVSSEKNIFVDENLMKTVIGNIFNNAIKFTKSGGRIVLDEKISDDLVEISIKDNGVGMDKSKLERLFKIEETSSEVGTDNEKGTGLGLILCKEFIEKNNGEIFVESESEKGSNFMIRLYGNGHRN